MNIIRKVYDNYGNMSYFNKNGLQHRLDGPAYESLDGNIKQWWINGKQYTEKQFNDITINNKITNKEINDKLDRILKILESR